TPPWEEEVTQEVQPPAEPPKSADDIVIVEMPWIDINTIRQELKNGAGHLDDKRRPSIDNRGHDNGSSAQLHQPDMPPIPLASAISEQTGDGDSQPRIATDPELGPYIYRDARGNPHAKVIRTPNGKSRFTQKHLNGKAW